MTRLLMVLAHAETGTLSVASTDVGEEYPSLTPDCPQAHWFEREIAEQWGVTPVGSSLAQAHPFPPVLPPRPRRLGTRRTRSRFSPA